LGSYFMDWNMSDDFLRGALATPNYGVAGFVAESQALPISLWNFSVFEAGQPLGHALLATENHKTGIGIDRMFAIMGDPTLRVHTLRPVTSLGATVAGGSTSLIWTAPAEQGTFQYYVLRAPNLSGTFVNLTPNGVATTSYSDSSSGNGSGVQYMVRATQLRNAGLGCSYYNASQGAFWPTVP
jgi:hypothetical protein